MISVIFILSISLLSSAPLTLILLLQAERPIGILISLVLQTSTRFFGCSSDNTSTKEALRVDYSHRRSVRLSLRYWSSHILLHFKDLKEVYSSVISTAVNMSLWRAVWKSTHDLTAVRRKRLLINSLDQVPASEHFSHWLLNVQE